MSYPGIHRCTSREDERRLSLLLPNKLCTGLEDFQDVSTSSARLLPNKC